MAHSLHTIISIYNIFLTNWFGTKNAPYKAWLKLALSHASIWGFQKCEVSRVRLCKMSHLTSRDSTKDINCAINSIIYGRCAFLFFWLPLEIIHVIYLICTYSVSKFKFGRTRKCTIFFSTIGNALISNLCSHLVCLILIIFCDQVLKWCLCI